MILQTKTFLIFVGAIPNRLGGLVLWQLSFSLSSLVLLLDDFVVRKPAAASEALQLRMRLPLTRGLAGIPSAVSSRRITAR